MADNLPSADCYYYIKVWQTPYYTIIFLFGKLRKKKLLRIKKG